MKLIFMTSLEKLNFKIKNVLDQTGQVYFIFNMIPIYSGSLVVINFYNSIKKITEK